MSVPSLERKPLSPVRSLPTRRHGHGGAEPLSLPRKRILVVHEHEVVQLGVRAILARLPWVDRCLSADAEPRALALLRRYEPDVAIVDLRLGGTVGPSLSRAIRAISPRTRVLLLVDDVEIAPPEARFAGAIGVVARSASAHELADAVRRAAVDQEVFPSGHGSDRELLTRREHEVLRLIAAGATNREISSRLFVSFDTVKRDARLIFRKLGVRNRAQAVERGLRRGLLTHMPAAASEQARCAS
jgi:DNA-binding NarL/FixJ family response regulator